MGLLSKIKNMFKGISEETVEKEEKIVEEEVEDDGLNPIAMEQEEPVEEVVIRRKRKRNQKENELIGENVKIRRFLTCLSLLMKIELKILIKILSFPINL